MIHLLLILLLIVNQPKNVKSDCDGCGVSMTYRLSSDLKPNCVNNCPYELKIDVFDSNNFNKQLDLTLTGYDIEESEAITLAVQFTIGTTTNYYICFKLDSGLAAAAASRFGLVKPVGSSVYNETNHSLRCSWSMKQTQKDLWPLNGSSSADIVKSSDFIISFNVNLTMVTVDSHPTGLTIYARKYLMCCGYKMHGNMEYSLGIRRNTNSTDFLFQFQRVDPNVVKIEFSIHDKNITAICYFDGNFVEGFITHKGVSHSVVLYNSQIIENVCRWTLPKLIKYGSEQIEIPMDSFDFKFTADGTVVYNGSKTDVNNSTSFITSGIAFTNSSFLVMIIFMMCLSLLPFSIDI